MNRIIALWAHPRSLSTVLERVMMERGDHTVLHEPFAYEYYVHAQKRHVSDMIVDTDHPHTYPEIKDVILQAAEAGPVFFKDMPYYCVEQLVKDDAFLLRLTNSFVIRHPAKAIASYYALDPHVTLEEIGCESQWHVFERVAALTGNTPVVVDAADLQQDPHASIAAYCQALTIPFLPEALQWDEDFKPTWQVWERWHTDVAQSRGIARRNKTYTATVDNTPHLQAYYAHHLPFYEQMHAHRLRP